MEFSRPAPFRFDARGSPAQALPNPMIDRLRPEHWSRFSEFTSSSSCDNALRWLMASDRVVSDQAARALLEVRTGKLHVKEGHARWSSYLRAFVPMTSRWCQQELRRIQALDRYPLLAAAWSEGSLSKSHVRALLRVLQPDTEATWLERVRGRTVRQIEEFAASDMAQEGAARPESGQSPGGEGVPDTLYGVHADADDNEDRPQRRVVMSPPAVAMLVARAVELARKVDGYQIGAGQAIAMMAAETIAGLHEYPVSAVAEDDVEPHTTTGDDLDGKVDSGEGGRVSQADRLQATEAEVPGSRVERPRPDVRSLLGDQMDLARELGPGWQEIHRHFEQVRKMWPDLGWTAPDILMEEGPPDDSDAHERVVFWTRLAGRLDAMRGRLLRIVEDRFQASVLGFASFGQYVRERMGLSLREAQDLTRLDRALEGLPVAFRMYAAGRLGKRAAWLVSRVATRKTERAWTRYAMTHTLRLLEVVVESACLKREVDPEGWERGGGEPPENASFPDAIRACSLLKGEGSSEPTVKVVFYLDSESRAAYEQAIRMLRYVAGGDKSEWYCLAAMAQHFLNCYSGAESEAVPEKLRRMMHRRVIERDVWTCHVPECLLRGRLEADHMTLRSHGGPTTMPNLVSLCAMDHRFTKHHAGSVSFWGEAPDRVFVRVGRRLYHNDRLVSPVFEDRILDEDPWAREEQHVPAMMPAT